MTTLVLAYDEAWRVVAATLAEGGRAFRRAKSIADACDALCVDSPPVVVLEAPAITEEIPFALRSVGDRDCARITLVMVGAGASLGKNSALLESTINVFVMSESTEHRRLTVSALLDDDVSAFLLKAARQALDKLPIGMRAGLFELFANRGRCVAMRDAALGSYMSQRTVQRRYREAGLAPLSELIGVARIANLWRLRGSGHLSVARATRLTGFGSARTLSRCCRRLANCKPSDVWEMNAREIADRLVAHILRLPVRTKVVPDSPVAFPRRASQIEER